MAGTTRAQLVQIGLLTVAGIVGLALLVFMFQPLTRIGRRGQRILIHFTYAGEVRRGTTVRHLGIDIGEVVHVAFAPPQRGGALVTVNVDPDVPLRNDPKARPHVDTKLVTGEAYIEFPRADPSAPLLKAGDEVQGLYRPTAADATQAITDVAQEAASAITDIRQVVREVGGSLAEASRSIQAVAGSARDLLEYRRIDDPARPFTPGGRSNVSTVVQRLDIALATLTRTFEGVNRLVDEGTLEEDVKTTLGNFRKASDDVVLAAADLRDAFRTVRSVATRADTVAVKIEHAVDDQNANLTRLTHSVLGASERLGEVLAQVAGLLGRVERGEGTLGRLFQDPALFERLVQAAARIDETVREINWLVKDLGNHPGDYIDYGRQRTSPGERRTRREAAGVATQPAP